MNKELKNCVDLMIEALENITPALGRKEIVLELQKYLAYIIAADGTISDGETKFINDYLDLALKTRDLANFITAYDLLNQNFTSTLPSAFKAILENAEVASPYIDLMEALGKECIVADDKALPDEVSRFGAYMQMLYDAYNARHPNHKKEFLPPTEETTKKEESKSPEEEKTLPELLEELDGLIGLQTVKRNVYTLVHLQDIQQEREKRGMKRIPISNHLVFMGNPGTGKTTVARLLARIYYRLGVIESNNFVEVDRSGLVAGYVGQTAIEVSSVMDTAKNGVLFIDEAYALATGLKGDYGHEAIQTILKRMEDERDKMVVIVAGYPKLMEQFVDSNPGLRSRFSKTIFFPDYTPEELLEILQYIAGKNNMKVSESALAFAAEILKRRYESRGENFANAREVRNMFEQAVLIQADRLYGQLEITDEELCTLEAEDFRMFELIVESDS